MFITYHKVSSQGAVSRHSRQRVSGQTTRHPVGSAGGALERAPGLAAHHVWPTDLTPFRTCCLWLGQAILVAALIKSLPSPPSHQLPAQLAALQPAETSARQVPALPGWLQPLSSSSFPPVPSLVIRLTCHFNPKSHDLLRMENTGLPWALCVCVCMHVW